MQVVTKVKRESYLRTKNRFYIAGWVASELCDTPQAYTGSNEKFQGYYDDYLSGYSDELANSAAMASLEIDSSGGYA